MAQMGLCSRREADELIERGWVYVDGQIVDRLGIKVESHQHISLAPQAQSRQKRLVTILLNKPVGYVSAQPEEGYRAAISLITASSQFLPRGKDTSTHKSFDFPGLAVAGRLDIDSKGLLVLTQDGRIARELISPHSKVEKEYLVRVLGEITDAKVSKLHHGLSLDGRRLRSARVDVLDESRLRFILTQGRKRQIRRMCELVDLKVTELKRVRIGDVVLGSLPVGKWRFLKSGESFCTP